MNILILKLIQDDERISTLEQKYQDLEEQFLCSICMERKKNIVFLCGHGACQPCTQVYYEIYIFVRLCIPLLNLFVLGASHRVAVSTICLLCDSALGGLEPRTFRSVNRYSTTTKKTFINKL